MDRKRSESREGRGREREGRRDVTGGERAQLMMKQGRVGVRVHYAFSSLAPVQRAHARGRVGR